MKIGDCVIQMTDVYYNEYYDTLIGYFDCSLRYLKTKTDLDNYKDENIICGDISLEIDTDGLGNVYNCQISPVASDVDGNETSIDWNEFEIEERILDTLVKEMYFIYNEGGAIVIRD